MGRSLNILTLRMCSGRLRAFRAGQFGVGCKLAKPRFGLIEEYL